MQANATEDLIKIMVLSTHAYNDSASGERACTGFTSYITEMGKYGTCNQPDVPSSSLLTFVVP